MTEVATRRGRRRDPAVDRAALQATLELLSEHGYAGLRVGDVAARAGVGLGALYRRWSTKRELVIAAVRQLAADQPPPRPARTPFEDLVTALRSINDALAGPDARVIASLLAERDTELAAAIREAKIEPVLGALRERLRDLLGDVPDLDARADLGPALLTFRALVLAERTTTRQIRDEIVPLILAEPATASRSPR
jgi:AcrR family transcriptional regulator